MKWLVNFGKNARKEPFTIFPARPFAVIVSEQIIIVSLLLSLFAQTVPLPVSCLLLLDNVKAILFGSVHSVIVTVK
ncbi:hypothetical protein [Virgibacillus pantothenticus]|uniref:hypothetical protein n=1 Tax=Virgibacillus pantothenticus TaxID=1473 RepID=UPI0025AF365E|nr:hypothetical protein [Virgibacillus pantothenticus]